MYRSHSGAASHFKRESCWFDYHLIIKIMRAALKFATQLNDNNNILKNIIHITHIFK